MESLLTPSGAPSSRRDFFKRASLGAGVLASASALQACDSDEPDPDGGAAVVLDFSTDNGVLNYAYALEQLEYAFYVKVLQTPFTGMTAAETALFTDLRAHEGIHQDFLKAALGTNAIGLLTADFSSINFTQRASVLAAAVTFEDLGVAAYNGAGKYLRDGGLLTIAGKIVSVEARHASAIRDLILNGTRSGATIGEAGASVPEVVGANALDRALEPSVVLNEQTGAGAFVTNTITLRGI
ncbi:MAG TPA: ferritin-like domain-containing protein [Rubricoccaceae bacterium]|jgi:hypothetical protein